MEQNSLVFSFLPSIIFFFYTNVINTVSVSIPVYPLEQTAYFDVLFQGYYYFILLVIYIYFFIYFWPNPYNILRILKLIVYISTNISISNPNIYLIIIINKKFCKYNNTNIYLDNKINNKVSLQISLEINPSNFPNIFLLDVNFEKSIIKLHFLIISSMPENFQKDQRLIAISLIKCLNFKFLYF